MSTEQWLRELGAIESSVGHRPWQGVGMLVLGKPSGTTYPIKWTSIPGRIEWQLENEYWEPRSGKPTENWYLFGIKTARPLTREDCERILKAVEGKK